MSDEEIICEFMEARPNDAPGFMTAWSSKVAAWWIKRPDDEDGVFRWHHRYLGLDVLHEVEARLIALGCRANIDNLLSQEVWRDASEAST